ncbi:hypothetical protein KSP40_PGU020822 [Platanthera guangdongensis]|uniref:Uncharacterized protein n=1 Tax=Platanthera guangdongensis TaxID=2320717 RepID=A0ABR2MGS1_9ASPA
MVYEFYANVKIIEGEMVTVKGKEVEFSVEKINDMFGLEDHDHDDYAEILIRYLLRK